MGRQREEFVIDRLIGKLVADGGEVPVRTGIPKGTVLYKVLWEGFPPETATWETEDDIPCGKVDFVGDYEEALAEDEEALAEEAAALAEEEAAPLLGRLGEVSFCFGKVMLPSL